MRTAQQPHGRWMKHGTWAWGIAIGCLMLMGRAAAQPTLSPVGIALVPGTFRLTVTDRALSLEANAASLAAIFVAIGQQAGIEIVLPRGVDQTITTHFTQVPLREAFTRLAHNVAILDTQEPQAPPHRIAKVYVLQAGQSEWAHPVIGEESPDPSTSQPASTPQAAARPKPFTFTFDPSRPEKQSQ